MATYYDFILAVIPGVMVGGPAVTSLLGLPLTLGALAGGTISFAVIMHGLFIRSPIAIRPNGQQHPQEHTEQNQHEPSSAQTHQQRPRQVA